MKQENYEILATGEIILQHSSKPNNISHEQEIKIEKVWTNKQQQKENKLFNDKVLNFVRIYKNKHKTFVEGNFIDYKCIIADREDPTLKLELNQIGVSGVIVISENNNNYVVFGIRENNITEYPGYFELVPSGNIDITTIDDGVIDFKSKLIEEFIEETGLTKENISNLNSLCFVKDCINCVYDVCCLIEIKSQKKDLFESFKKVSEYKKLEIISFSELSAFIRKNYKKIVPTSLAVLECLETS